MRQAFIKQNIILGGCLALTDDQKALEYCCISMQQMVLQYVKLPSNEGRTQHKIWNASMSVLELFQRPFASRG